jgi:hypothetical protein
MEKKSKAQARKEVPVNEGFLKYFPNAIRAAAHLSFVGNEQHNPGQKLKWDRSKSQDHADCLLRHLMDHEENPVDEDGQLHLTKVFWRAGALLQIYLEGLSGHDAATDKNLDSPSTRHDDCNSIKAGDRYSYSFDTDIDERVAVCLSTRYGDHLEAVEHIDYIFADSDSIKFLRDLPDVKRVLIKPVKIDSNVMFNT